MERKYFTIFLYITAQIAFVSSETTPSISSTPVTEIASSLTQTSTLSINPTRVSTSILPTFSGNNDSSSPVEVVNSSLSTSFSATNTLSTLVSDSKSTKTNSLKPSQTFTSPSVVLSSTINVTTNSTSVSQTHIFTNSSIIITSQTFSSTLDISVTVSLSTQPNVPSTDSLIAPSTDSLIVPSTSSVTSHPSPTSFVLSTIVTSENPTSSSFSSIKPSSTSTVSPSSSSIVPTSTTAPENRPSKSKKSGLSSGGKAAIGIFVTVLIIAVIIGLLWMRKRKWFRGGTSITSSIQYKPWKYTDEASVNIQR
ncbi:uncharacterized protein LOC132743738 isoform X2 [Ruditapes philippinarum]|uniref:uncharacterized protein LOC132743738 isoform X2 n=1 Tax=Ruditapes philippinarum TaxID=129788 RepID=UPI00295B9E33|nr:uncharacterized protein LOC132743738 isoform X2 [Ruditapes philippinarum]